MSQSTSTTATLVSDKDRADRLSPTSPGLIRLYPWSSEVAPELVTVKRRCIIGRDESCQIVLNHSSVSRKHAELRPVGVSIDITDLGSRNKCSINTDRVESQGRADPGDVVSLGGCLFLVVSAAGLYCGWWVAGTEAPILGGPRMGEVRQLVQGFGPLENTQKNQVLITREIGTGKEVVARELHRASGRSGPFVAVNCSAVPRELFESQFFGHKRGAFTGADRDSPGYFRRANGGTIFLDEVGELDIAVQPKLLRALENQEVMPVGATMAEPIDVRVIAATNRDLLQDVQSDRFRGDLYSRLHVLTIPLLPLRERREDVVVLARHFLRDLEVRDLTPDATLALVRYQWPWNARELRSALAAASAQAKISGETRIAAGHLRPEIARHASPPAEPEPDPRTAAVLAAMRRHQGNVSRAAEELGLHRPQVYDAVRAAGYEPGDFRQKS